MTLKHISARLAAAVLMVSTIITPALAANGTVTTEGSPLRLRSEASIEGSVLNKLANGTQVEVLSSLDGGWYQVVYQGVTGFVSAEYLTVEEEAEELDELQYLGCRYVYGGSSPKGFDCSGFTSYIYKQFGVSIHRTASGQLNNGYAVSRSDLKPGDLVMFKSYGSKPASHVGIYIGGDEFVHSSAPGVGVVIDSLNSSFYSSTYVGARRVF